MPRKITKRQVANKKLKGAETLLFYLIVQVNPFEVLSSVALYVSHLLWAFDFEDSLIVYVASIESSPCSRHSQLYDFLQEVNPVKEMTAIMSVYFIVFMFFIQRYNIKNHHSIDV